MVEVVVEHGDGTRYWYLNGKRHREDGPAVEYSDGSKYWYLNDELHREDGPAIEYHDGTKFWLLNGVEYSFNDWIKMVDISYEEKCELVLIYA